MTIRRRDLQDFHVLAFVAGVDVQSVRATGACRLDGCAASALFVVAHTAHAVGGRLVRIGARSWIAIGRRRTVRSGGIGAGWSVYSGIGKNGGLKILTLVRAFRCRLGRIGRRQEACRGGRGYSVTLQLTNIQRACGPGAGRGFNGEERQANGNETQQFHTPLDRCEAVKGRKPCDPLPLAAPSYF